MKTLRLLFLVSIGIFSSVLSFSQTIDEIVTKHLEAVGGQDAWRKINSLKIDATLNVQGTDVTIALTQLHKKGLRQDLSVMGMNGYQILTPDKGWSFMPFQGQTAVTEMSAEEVKESQGELDIQGSLLDYKQKGRTAELAGKEMVDGKELLKINLALETGKKETLYIDPSNFYIVRSIATQKVNGQDQEVISLFSDFQKVDGGIIVPKTIELPYGKMTIKTVQVNQPVDENIFKPEK